MNWMKRMRMKEEFCNTSTEAIKCIEPEEQQQIMKRIEDTMPFQLEDSFSSS